MNFKLLTSKVNDTMNVLYLGKNVIINPDELTDNLDMSDSLMNLLQDQTT